MDDVCPLCFGVTKVRNILGFAKGYMSLGTI